MAQKQDKTYTAESITVLEGLEAVRKEYDLNWLASQINERGDLLKLSKATNIGYSVLKRAVEEVTILKVFPGIAKSKANPLSRLKTKKELMLFASIYDIYNLEVREIYRLVKGFRKQLEKNPMILLTPLQQDLLIGSMLGDGSILQREINSSFRVCHSPKQAVYLKYKYNILNDFTISPIVIGQRILNDNLINTYQFSTISHPIFNYYRKLFYKNGTKTITEELLDLLNPRSLTFWICDDGSYCKKQRYIILCTNSYSFEEHKLMKGYFEKRWEISPTIGFRDNKYYYLRFKIKDTEKLISIIKPFIPKGMEYKIGE